MSQITKNEVIQSLVEVYPPFKESFRANQDYYLSNGELQLYSVASDIATEIVKLYKRNEVSSLNAIFSFIETLLERGDEYVKELATVGFLEDIQNHSEWAEVDPQVLAPYLGPQSKKAWDDVGDFWSGRTPLIGVSWEELAAAKIRERGVTEPSELELKQEIVKLMESQVRIMGGNKLSGLHGLAIVFFAIIGLIVFLVILALLLPQ